MKHVQCIFFIWIRIYKEIFKSALVYFQVRQSPEAVIHRCSPVKLVKFLRTPLQNASGNCFQTSSFENYTYFIWTYFDYHKNKHKVLYQNHWLALYTVEMFGNFILRNHWSWTWKNSDSRTGLRFLWL